MNKKFFIAICSLCVCLCVCFGFSACKKSTNNTLAYDTAYKFSTVSFMGFTGTRDSLSAYIEDPNTIEDHNFMIEYFDMVKQLELKFVDETNGKIIIHGLAEITNFSSFTTENNIDTSDIIDEDGNAAFTFKYTKDGDTITVSSINVGEALGGNIDLVEFLNTFTGNAEEEEEEQVEPGEQEAEEESFVERHQIKISENANKLKLVDGKVVLNIYFSYKMAGTYPGSDIESTLSIAFAR